MTIYFSESLIDGIKKAKNKGHLSTFLYKNNQLVNRETNEIYGKDDCFIVEYMRFEGLNDPSDSSILFLIECHDGNKGYLSSSFGIYADQELLNFISQIKKVNHEELTT